MIQTIARQLLSVALIIWVHYDVGSWGLTVALSLNVVAVEAFAYHLRTNGGRDE